jgi:hypothetical protein
MKNGIVDWRDWMSLRILSRYMHQLLIPLAMGLERRRVMDVELIGLDDAVEIRGDVEAWVKMTVLFSGRM